MKILLMGVCFLAVTAWAAELPEPVLPAGVGVNIHFTKGHEQDLDLIAAGGFKFIRMDFHWGGIERKKGEYDWSEYDELTANMERRGLRAIYIFDYSSGLYEETISVTNKHTHHVERALCSPQHTESVAAFARWAGAAAAHFRGHRIVWEIWNEPNISFWKPKPDAEQYTALALATVKAVRAADPQATIIAPGSSEFPWAFFETLFASGILKDLDAVSVHPYRGKPPETAASDYEKLRALIARHAPADKKNLPIISGEWGYSTQHKGTLLATQGAYLPRQQLANLLAGVPLSIWYDWKNDGSDTNYNEHNFGTVTTKLQPKPSYLAVQELARELTGYRVARRLETAETNDWILLCLKSDGSQRLAGWTLAAPHSATLALTENPLTLELDAAPKYIAITPPDPRLALAASWQALPQNDAQISAADGGKAVIRVHATNPLAEPVTAKFSAAGFEGGTAGLTLQLAAHGQGSGDLAGCFSRRDRETLPVVVSAEFGSKSVAATQAIRQQVNFMRTDPLRLSLMPVAGGLRALIENPGLTAFSGSLQVGEAKSAVMLATGVERTTIALASTAATQAVLTDERGTVVAESSLPRMTVVDVPLFHYTLDGDKNIPAKVTLAPAAAPGPDAPFNSAFKLDYDFAAGWRFIRCFSAYKTPMKLTGHPAAFGIWVFGDKSGNRLNARIVDASGQTFQIGGPEIDWTGWRWITFPVADLKHASHWGGANDGKIHGALHWDCPLLLDSNHRNITSTIYFAGLTLLDAQP
ncbi:MAG: cellulase family glycosylhydrolase [Kiritimatiellaeota bacterium]|nr:cellulase family glycosylhydrolase [Kiritimatiellota bacterium]